MDAKAILVIGASAGGVEAIQSLVAKLPRDFPAAVFVVVHIGAHRSELPWILNRYDTLPARHPADGDPIEAGHIYVAPPDHHMMVAPGVIHLNKGPRENWARPAIDPLFRSAARAYGPAAIGVILSGSLNDGTAGLFEIEEHGGTTIVQDPREAASPSMPRSALAHVAVDHCLPLADMPELFIRLARALVERARPPAEEYEGQEMSEEYTEERPVALTCPECGGAVRRTELGSLTQYRCHIGHVFTAEVMLAAQFLVLEKSLEMAMRTLNERAELCRQIAAKLHEEEPGADVAIWEAAMREADDQQEPLRELLTREWIQAGLSATWREDGGMLAVSRSTAPPK